MLMNFNSASVDGISYATTVRSLARRAHRLLRASASGRAVDPREVAAVLRQIDDLMGMPLSGPRAELQGWSGRLREQVAALARLEPRPDLAGSPRSTSPRRASLARPEPLSEAK